MGVFIDLPGPPQGTLYEKFSPLTACESITFQPVTELLVRWRARDSDGLASLVPLVYKELRDIARRHLTREHPGHTSQSAALVHEAYLRMLDQRPFDSENRAHFLAVASRLMRQVLVDHARTHGAAKRGLGLFEFGTFAPTSWAM